MVRFGKNGECLEKRELLHSFKKMSLESNGKPDSNCDAAFQHVQENIDQLEERNEIKETDLIFLQRLMDSPVRNNLAQNREIVWTGNRVECSVRVCERRFKVEMVRFGKNGECLEKRELLHSFKKMSLESNGKPDSNCDAAFQHVQENIDQLEERNEIKETDLIFLQRLMDSPVRNNLAQVQVSVESKPPILPPPETLRSLDLHKDIYIRCSRSWNRDARELADILNQPHINTAEEDLKRTLEDSASMQRTYDKYIDQVITNNDFDMTFRQIIEALEALTTEHQWVPVNWIY
ncbi:hypothetical protein HUJ05_005379 [Dendroctonus ponderosae]|nr:hypothetical protein HUJ05_005379 [Dendroctonus ponderosae]